jgi:hypothetical protein
MLYKVDLILGEEFLHKYDCILHYGNGCIMIRKGKRHMTVNSAALPRSQLSVDDEKSVSVLLASQVKRLARKGARVFLAVIRPVETDSVPPMVASVAALSPGVPTSCWAVPPRPCLGSIAVHDIRCTTVTPFIKGCLTEAILIPHMNHAVNISLDTKRIIT